jgi:hypothetical protein
MPEEIAGCNRFIMQLRVLKGINCCKQWLIDLLSAYTCADAKSA